MRNGLGIGIGAEDMALGAQLRAQFPEVLYDAVVDDGNLVGCVRMGVVLARAAMCGPAGMTDAGRSLQWRPPQQTFEVGNPAFRAATLNASQGEGGDPCGIIPPVFQPFEAVDDLFDHIAFADYADYSAHFLTPSDKQA